MSHASNTPPGLMFGSWHAYADPSSGAALSTRDLFEDLTAHGWTCRVVCGPQYDSEEPIFIPELLTRQRVGYRQQYLRSPTGLGFHLFHYAIEGVPVTQYLPDTFTPHRPPNQAEGVPFLDVFSQAVEQFRPGVVLTYGGPPINPHLIRRARKRGARVVFSLHNLAYRTNSKLFEEVDVLRVPSRFAHQRYAEIGIQTEAVPWPWDMTRAIADRVDGQFVTFVNPQPSKGVAWFARIAIEMSKRRPEIQFLVVEGRGKARWLDRMGFNLRELGNVHRMETTPWPREFYSQSRMVLMPSIWEETFGRVAVEAMANGIPVLASNRGALPDTLGEAGMVFDIPPAYVADPNKVPTAMEVDAWLVAIERLWEDDAYDVDQSQHSRERAKELSSASIRPQVEQFLHRLTTKSAILRSRIPPGPPTRSASSF